jgi:hypothetical protein
VKREVLRSEARVAAADVEGEVRRARAESVPKPGDGVVQIRPPVAAGRAEVERRRSLRIGRVEVAAPRLDDPKVVQVVQDERDRAVPARGKPDDGPGASVGDRPIVGVDIGRKLLRDRPLPVAARTPVEVLRVCVVVVGPLGRDQDRLRAKASERVAQEADVSVGVRGRGQAVKEVDDRVATRGVVISGRQQDDEVDASPHGPGRERRAPHRRLAFRALALEGGLSDCPRRDQRDEDETPADAPQRADTAAARAVPAGSAGARVSSAAPATTAANESSRATPSGPEGSPSP